MINTCTTRQASTTSVADQHLYHQPGIHLPVFPGLVQAFAAAPWKPAQAALGELAAETTVASSIAMAGSCGQQPVLSRTSKIRP